MDFNKETKDKSIDVSKVQDSKETKKDINYNKDIKEKSIDDLKVQDSNFEIKKVVYSNEEEKDITFFYLKRQDYNLETKKDIDLNKDTQEESIDSSKLQDYNSKTKNNIDSNRYFKENLNTILFWIKNNIVFITLFSFILTIIISFILVITSLSISGDNSYVFATTGIILFSSSIAFLFLFLDKNNIEEKNMEILKSNHNEIVASKQKDKSIDRYINFLISKQSLFNERLSHLEKYSISLSKLINNEVIMFLNKHINEHTYDSNDQKINTLIRNNLKNKIKLFNNKLFNLYIDNYLFFNEENIINDAVIDKIFEYDISTKTLAFMFKNYLKFLIFDTTINKQKIISLLNHIYDLEQIIINNDLEKLATIEKIFPFKENILLDGDLNENISIYNNEIIGWHQINSLKIEKPKDEVFYYSKEELEIYKKDINFNIAKYSKKELKNSKIDWNFIINISNLEEMEKEIIFKKLKK